MGCTGNPFTDQREGLREQSVDLVGLGHGARPERLLRHERSDLGLEIRGFYILLRNRFGAATELERHPGHATAPFRG